MRNNFFILLALIVSLCGSYGDTYIDNCRVVKVGEVGALELQQHMT